MPSVAFVGFRSELVDFLIGLKANNNREWFEAHGADYEHYLLDPARDFFRLTPESLTLGAGMHGFSDDALERFRHAVLDPVQYQGFASLQQWLVDLLAE